MKSEKKLSLNKFWFAKFYVLRNPCRITCAWHNPCIILFLRVRMMSRKWKLKTTNVYKPNFYLTINLSFLSSIFFNMGVYLFIFG